MINQLNEEKIVKIVADSIKGSDIFKAIEKDKDFEKKVKEITVEVMTEFFRVMFQHSGIFKNLAKK
jgi:hypothetical protein